MSFQFSRKACLLALLMLMIGVVPVLAQVPTGSIVGTVLDAQKAAIAGADVTITSQDTGVQYKTQTASNGGYAVQSLNFGLYRVDVSKQGFKTASITDLKLDASSQLSVPPIVLEIGAISQTVTVEAGASEEVQTTSAAVGDQIDKAQLDNLPVNGRQPESLIELEPGVAFNGKTDTVIDGQRVAFTSVTMDGINIQDNFIRANDTDFSPNQIFLSQTGEFHINTQNGDPSVGGGSSAVSIVTPRGTNNWHGKGFLYYQTNKWNANPWFNNAFGVPNALLNQDQYGGQGGGPVVKNKLFVYGSFEEFKAASTTLQNATIFTSPAAQSGTFSYHTDCDNVTITCPAGVTPGQLVSANLLTLENTSRGGASPVFTIDPAIAALIARIPSNAVVNNTQIGDGINTAGFDFNARNDALLKNTGGRADYTPTEHNSFSASYYWNRQIFDRPDIDTSFNTVPIVRNFDAINFLSTAWRWSPNSNYTNEVRFGYDLAPATFNTGQKFGPSIITGTAFTNPDPNFYFQGRDTHTWSWQDNANLLRGNHSIIAGMQVQRVTIDAVNNAGTSTDFALGFGPSNNFALQTSDFSGVAPISANDLGDANGLLATFGGFVGTTTQTFNVKTATSGFVSGATQERNLRQNNWAFYVGDAWRFRPNLTFTYGMRYEYLSPFNEKNGLMLEPIPGIGQSVVDTLLSDATVGFVGGSSGRRPYNKDLHDFGPNFGIAWDPSGNGKMAIRAGYSIHYVNDDLATAVLNAVNGNAGLSSTNGSIDPGVGAGATVSGVNTLPAASLVAPPPFLIPTTFGQNFANLGGAANNAGFAISPSLTTPYVQDWNLSVQREIGFKTTVTVSYLGNHATNLIRGLDINQVNINQSGLLSSFNVARNNCFASIAAGGGCDPNFAGTGSEPPSGILYDAGTTNTFAPFLNSSFVTSRLQFGEVGDLADQFHIRGIEDFPGQFTANELIRGGDLIENFSSSSFNAGVVQIQRRFSHDLIFQGNYTYSKVIDDADGSQSNFSPLIDNANPRAARGRANFDITHAFKTNFVYALPFGKGERFATRGGILNDVVGGWKVSSVVTLQSGAPFSILSGRGTLNRNGRSGLETASIGMSASQLKNAIHLSFPSTIFGPIIIDPSFISGSGRGAGPDGLTCSPLVANGFCNPLPGQQGNLSKNMFNGPKFFNTDLSILKSIPIRESMSLQLRGDAFNAFNHPTFFVGDQSINSSAFGQVSGVNGTISNGGGARVLQIGAEFIF
ncbi:MAG TPA: TonB-dependent receptor [Candidatus Acidoferrales bacterium]|nr:TonB-dependent receptor [Candidatus Acidoferrales bacterium]